MNRNTHIFSEKKILIPLLILNIMFLVYYVILAFYSRPHYDDLHFLWELKQMSIGSYVSEMYYSRSGRFIGYFINGVVFKTILLVGEHRFFPILFWLLGVSICWSVSKSMFKSISQFFLFNTVLLFFNLFVLTNIDFAVFNWLCAMSYYILPPMLLLVISYVNKKQLSWIQWFVLLVISVVLGGGQEAFTPVVLSMLFLNGLYYFKIHHFRVKEVWMDTRIRKIIIAASVMLLCFIIVVIAPGNYKRMAADEFVSPRNLMGYAVGFVKAIGMFYYYITFYLPYYLILGLLFMYIGSRMQAEKSPTTMSYKKTGWISLVLYGLYMLPSTLPNVYLWSGFGIQRNYTHVVFFTMLFICFHAFLFGYFKMKNEWKNALNFSLKSGVIILCYIMLSNIYFDTISARNYAQSVDKRIEMLQKMNKQGVVGVVSVDSVSTPYTVDPKYLLYKLLAKKTNPHPVLYYISDTEAEPNEYAFHLQKIYGFNFLIKLNNQTNSDTK
jgi:hypothetical protein